MKVKKKMHRELDSLLFALRDLSKFTLNFSSDENLDRLSVRIYNRRAQEIRGAH